MRAGTIRILGVLLAALAINVTHAATGEETVDDICSICHASGLFGAPRIGSAQDWAPRTKKGLDKLLRHAIRGTGGGMPPRGGGRSLTDDDLKAAIEYMVGLVGGFEPKPADVPQFDPDNAAHDSRSWKSLAADYNHDPEAPGVALKQQPTEALSQLPPDNVGNKVRWVKALQQGYIVPRAQLYPSTEVKLLDLDILMPDTAEMPYVLFPHRRHTEWLDCSNCHPVFFNEEAGTTPVNMYTVLMGEHCGRCHGAVSFPLTECERCHSVAPNPALFRLGREFIRPGLSEYQDSDRVIMARPKSHYEEKGDAKP